MIELMKNKTNRVSAAGEVVSDLVYSHTVFGEEFYFLHLKVKRQSGAHDIIPLLVSERLLDIKESYRGRFLHVEGQFRSFNQQSGGDRHLILMLFVQNLELVDADSYCGLNSIMLDGFLCRKPVFRVTPKGREIADFMIAVNRSYGQSDYIPCICWGRNARYVQKLPVGSRFHIDGRIQSRSYLKRDPNGKISKKIAFEISVATMFCVRGEEERQAMVADSQTPVFHK